jgi:NTE family protein
MTIKNKKVHLVLASGGARGIAHIGVIEKLEEAGCEIVEIAGGSMGAVVGGLYAADKLTEYKEWLLKLDRTAVFRLLDFTFARQGFVKGEKVFSTIMEMMGPQKIEDLRIPYCAVATDLKTGDEVVFKSGDLFKAMRASISIPGVFTPVAYEGKSGHFLVDGGVINPLPINQISKKEGNIVVAVDINAFGAKPELLKQDTDEDDEEGWLKKNWPFSKKEEGPSNPSVIEVIQTSFDLMQNQLVKRDLSFYQPDYVIHIPRNTCGTMDFHLAPKILEIGRQAFDDQIVHSKKAQAHLKKSPLASQPEGPKK